MNNELPEKKPTEICLYVTRRYR